MEQPSVRHGEPGVQDAAETAAWLVDLPVGWVAAVTSKGGFMLRNYSWYSAFGG